MNNDELHQALVQLKAIIGLMEKREWSKGIRTGAITGGHQVQAPFQTEASIDASSAAELDAGADAWIALLAA